MAKKALCLSEQALDAHWQQLHNHTIGLAFLGTPHRGSNIASFAAGISQILKVARKRVNADILSLLRRDSEVLADIDASFGTWLRKRENRVEITCFSEELELPGIGLVRNALLSSPFLDIMTNKPAPWFVQVVSKESSQISGYPRYTIPANHMVLPIYPFGILQT